MKIDSSLHLVLLHDSAGCEGYGLNYREFRGEVRKYPKHGEISESGWYVVSSDADIAIQAHLSKFLPGLPSDHGALKKGVRIVSGSVVQNGAEEADLIADPLGQRLFVVRVYYPGSKDLANPHMKALYDKLVGQSMLSAASHVAAE